MERLLSKEERGAEDLVNLRLAKESLDKLGKGLYKLTGKAPKMEQLAKILTSTQGRDVPLKRLVSELVGYREWGDKGTHLGEFRILLGKVIGMRALSQAQVKLIDHLEVSADGSVTIREGAVDEIQKKYRRNGRELNLLAWSEAYVNLWEAELPPLEFAEELHKLIKEAPLGISWHYVNRVPLPSSCRYESNRIVLNV